MWFGMVSGLVSNRGIVFSVHYSIAVSLLILGTWEERKRRWELVAGLDTLSCARRKF